MIISDDLNMKDTTVRTVVEDIKIKGVCWTKCAVCAVLRECARMGATGLPFGYGFLWIKDIRSILIV